MNNYKFIAIDIDDTRLNIASEQNLANHFLNPNKCDIETEIKMIVGEIVSKAMNNEMEGIITKVEEASNKLKFRNTKCKILK